MQKLFGMLAGICALGFVASAATAGTLMQANLDMSLYGAHATFNRTTADGLAGASTSSTATLAPGAAFAGTSAMIPLTTSARITNATFVLGGNGKIQIAPGGATVTAPLQASARFGGAPGPFVTVPLALGAGTPGNPVSLTTSFTVPVGVSVHGTLSGTGWHVGTVTATGLTVSGAPISNVTVHGSSNLDGNGAGTVTLVTLSRITLTGDITRKLAEPTYLTLTYVPEPGSLLLLGVAAMGLLATGRGRRR